MTPTPLGDSDRSRHIAAEVVELGETLFDSALEAAVQRTSNNKAEPFPEQQIRTAADEFFQTLRALLGLPEEEPLSS